VREAIPKFVRSKGKGKIVPVLNQVPHYEDIKHHAVRMYWGVNF